MTQSHNTLETLVPQVPADGGNPFNTDLREPSTPIVLEAVDTGMELRERPVSVLCPGCGAVMTRYRSGLPLRVAHYETDCEHCAATLQRWAVVAIDTAYEQAPSPATLRQTVTSYWDEHLWAGIVTGETSPRTAEYSQLYAEQAETFGWDWEVTCPLCRRPVAELDTQRLDYHHWRRDPDQGVCLCRTCHDGIDGQQTDGDLDWQAQQLGLRDKHDLQITRLALREQAVSPCESLTALVERIHDRYNLIQSPGEVFALLSQTLIDQTLLEQTHDGYLLSGVQP